jgi:DNA-binding transcriptional ArsR family regulator
LLKSYPPSRAQRWRILRELATSGPLPVCEIAKRLRATESGISKHFAVLRDSGIVYNHYGLYAIDRRFLVPGEHSLDFGHVLVRLDVKG